MSAAAGPIDQAVRDDIRFSLDESLVVEAGAGTGKTTVLVERIAELLARGRATVDQIAVMTFTEKAAGELGARVREKLEERRADTADGAEGERLDAALRDLHRAHVQTIHAFAADLLRERPVEAELDPQFEVLDAVAEEVDFESAYRAWTAELLAGEHPEVVRALNRRFELRELRQAADALQAHRHLLPQAAWSSEPPRLRELCEFLDDAAAQLDELGPRCSAPDDDRGFAQISLVADFARRCRGVANEEELERLVLFDAPGLKKRQGNQDSWPQAGDCDALRAVVDSVRERVEDAQRALRTDALLGVLPLVEEFVVGYASARRRAGRANFDDLLIWARDLLRDKPEVRASFQARFTHVLVDEFQDTDPTQAELLAWLTSDGAPAGDWRDLRPVPGKLVVVGDPKQSIYRFRRADITVYDEVKRGPLDGGLREIVQNFRSLNGVLDWINTVFDRLFVEERGKQPANVRLEASPSELELERPSIVVVRTEPGDSADGLRVEEARTVAAVLRRAVLDEHWMVRDPDRADAPPRPARWRDVAVLFPWRTGIERWEEQLALAGIPFRHEGSRGFHSRQEVRELVALLLCVDDPTDRISLVAALRSNAAGCSDEDIFSFVAGGGVLDYRVRPDGAVPAVADALALLHALHRERRGLSLPELVRRVIERTHIVEFALTLPGGDQAAANVLKLADHARAFAAGGGGGLRPFAQWLARQRDEENPESDASVADETDDLVRLMTIHAAKGLEFPIVALANMSQRPLSRAAAVPDATSRRIHVRVGHRDYGRFGTPGFEDANDLEREFLDAERRRWLYVATTRCRDHLVLPLRSGKPDPKSMLEDLLDDLPGPDAEPGPAGAAFVYDPALLEDDREAARVEDHPVPAGAVAAAEGAREDWAAALGASVGRASVERAIVTATELEDDEERPVRTPLVADDGSILLPTGSGRAAEVGDALHAVMEHVALDGDGDGVNALAAQACAALDLEERAGEVAELARSCLRSPAVRAASKSGGGQREVPFMVARDDGVLVAGRIDLLFREEERVVIVDYKTDTVAAADLDGHVESHRTQAEVYAEAATRATGLAVSEVVFVFARTGEERALAVGAP